MSFLLLLIVVGVACLEQSSTEDPPILEEAHVTSETAFSRNELTLMLLMAAEDGDAEAVQSLLDQGADVHFANSRGVTPLIAAAYRNHLAVVRLLIEAGADVNVQDNTQQSAYLIATSDGHVQLLELTLAAGADVHSLDSFNGTGLIRAADRGHIQIIERLLETDIDIDHVNRLGWTALLEAIILGDGGERHTEVVRLLVEAGADVTIADSNGVTPLEHAQNRGFSEMIAILEGQQPNQLVHASPTPFVVAETAVPTPIPHPLTPYTIAGMRSREFAGGDIQKISTLKEEAAFTQYYISYPSDGLTVTGSMHVPAGEDPFPVLILLHGYFNRDNYFTGADTWQAAEYFARQGYLVVAPDFRSWGESDWGVSLFHMGLVADVLHLIGSLDRLPEADASRVGLWGHSMGGGIATKVLTIDERVKTAVLYAPNSADDADLIARWGLGCQAGQSEAAGDRCNPAEIVPENLPMDVVEAYFTAVSNPELLRQVAPIYHLEHVQVPVQIHIGTADGANLAETPPEWSTKLADALQAANKEVELFVYPDQGHFFAGESWVIMLERAGALFEQQVKALP